MKEQTIYLVQNDKRQTVMIFARYDPAKEFADLGGYIVVPWDMVL
jgi:hypothetical protein